jgi:hypothetical protein
MADTAVCLVSETGSGTHHHPVYLSHIHITRNVGYGELRERDEQNLSTSILVSGRHPERKFRFGTRQHLARCHWSPARECDDPLHPVV